MFECYPDSPECVLRRRWRRDTQNICDVCGLDAETGPGVEMERHGRLYVSDEAGLDPSISSNSGRRFDSGCPGVSLSLSGWQMIDILQIRRSPFAVRLVARQVWENERLRQSKKSGGGAPRRRGVPIRVIESNPRLDN